LAAHHDDLLIRDKAFKYFIDNFNDKYSKDYDPNQIDIAFIPCSDPNIYAIPSEVFIDPECTIMKFQTVRKKYRLEVEKFGVRRCPSNEELKNRLIEDPPQDIDEAKEIFEYLASREGSFDWMFINDIDFIPIRDKTRPEVIILKNPHSCFFKDQERYYFFFLLYKRKNFFSYL